MQRIHEYEVDDVKKNGWTPVTLDCWGDDAIDQWLRETPGGHYVQAYFALTWYFENEQDALLFKLKFGSYKGKPKTAGGPFGAAWEGVIISQDIASMYPSSLTMKVIKNRCSEKEYRSQHQQEFIVFDCEGSFDPEKYRDLYSGSTQKKKMRS